MVSFSKRRKRNLALAILFFLLLAVVPILIFIYLEDKTWLVLASVVGVTGLISTPFFFYGRFRGAAGVVVVGLIIGAGIYFFGDRILPLLTPSSEPGLEVASEEGEEGEIQLTVRVIDGESNPIDNAQVLIFHDGPPRSQISDVNGVAIFDTNEAQLNARLVVKHAEHEISEKEVSLTVSGREDVQLSRKDETLGRVITYVVDNEDGRPLNGARVTIIADGNVFHDTTDDTGLARFELDFPTGQLDVELNVSTDDYITTNRSLTIRPNDVQNIRLNAEEETIVVAEEITVAEEPTLSTSFTAAASAETVGATVEPINEEEPNDTQENAQTLSAIGVETPVQATIRAAASDGDPGDVDWYEFTAVAGQTYVIELYNVANNIDLVSRRYNCSGSRTYTGMRIILYDPAGNEVNRVCIPNGRGNVHTLLSFVAGVDGTHTFQVAAHAPEVSGDYSLRVLPRYDDALARWDGSTYEPNNTLANAFAITPGHENGLTSVLESRKSRYSTNSGDVDVYRFTAVAGQSYVIELYNVANNLSLESHRYGCEGSSRTYAGLRLIVYDPAENEVGRQCTPNGVGNVHTIYAFTAGSSGDHFLHVAAHEGTVSGNYSLRVLPRHSEPGAGWEADTFEPNNQAANGYELTVDGDPLPSRIENASTVYSTRRTDADWYRFEVEAGITYIVEISDIDSGIAESTLRYGCEGSSRTYSGFFLAIHDNTVTEVSRQCAPNGSGTVHTAVEFTAARSGTYYAVLYPHNGEASGVYTIHVRQQ
ncbi:hypothetical protein [Candidatus Leptofilum sp.]|uniref:hypothetical protein n=1 Tax=Candidatus Leptofilum sp. TaxID=3241576 RepID=UPI003B5C22C1